MTDTQSEAGQGPSGGSPDASSTPTGVPSSCCRVGTAAREVGLEDRRGSRLYALRARGERRRPTNGWDSLTPTELQVVELVRSGRTNREVADQLLMGVETVKTHLSQVITKLGTANRSQLTALATERAKRSRITPTERIQHP